MIKYILFISFFILVNFVQGQNNRSSIFWNDGVYMSMKEWQNNKPTYSWNEVKANLVVNPQTWLSQVEFLRRKNEGTDISLDSVWAIVLHGIPYIRLTKGEAHKTLQEFAGLRLRGALCYYSYSYDTLKKVEISAYNPVTGKPYMSSKIDKPETVIIEKIFRFTEPFQITTKELSKIEDLIRDDNRVLSTWNALNANEKLTKLKDIIAVYNDRHPLHLPNKTNN